jgi:hypothetical protein
MKIFIEEVRRRYRVYFIDTSPNDSLMITKDDCSLLLGAAHDPEFEASRALLELGYRGRLEVWRFGVGFPSMILDIERAAKFTIEETDAAGPRLRRYRTAYHGVSVTDATSYGYHKQSIVEHEANHTETAVLVGTGCMLTT